MAILIQRKQGYTKKPNNTPGLSAKWRDRITNAFIFNDDIDLVDGRALTFSGGCNIANQILTGDGVDGYADAEIDCPVGSDKRFYGGIVTLGQFSESTTSVIWAHGDADVGTETVILFAEDNALSVGFGGHRIITPKSTLSVGQTVSVVVQTTGPTSAETKIYIDGIKQATTNEGGSSLTLATSDFFRFFDDYNGAANYGKHDIELFYCGKGNLSQDEVASLHDNPYQILNPRRKYWVLPTAAAPSGFQAAWAARSNNLIGGGISR